MYQPQEPSFRFNYLYAIFNIPKILWWFSILCTKQIFRYREQQVLPRISSSMFRILFFSESSNYLRNQEKIQLFHLAFVKNRSLMSLVLCAENAGKCPLSTQHRLVKVHSWEQSLFSGHHSVPIQCCQCNMS